LTSGMFVANTLKRLHLRDIWRFHLNDCNCLLYSIIKMHNQIYAMMNCKICR